MRTVLSLFVLVFALAASALAQSDKAQPRPQRPRAAYRGYIVVAGAQLGKFVGAGRSKSGKIPIVSITPKVENPKTKNRMAADDWRPWIETVTVESVDAKEFEEAVRKHEKLSSASITMLKTTADGRTVKGQVLNLTGATVTKVTHPKGNGNRELTLIQIAFEKVDIERRKGKTSATDDWTQ